MCTRRTYLGLCALGIAFCVGRAHAGEVVLYEPQTADGLVAVEITYRPTEGEAVTGMQFDINYNSAHFEVVDMVAGAAPEAAGMTTYTGEPSVDAVRLLSSGLGGTPMGEGTVATIYLRPLSDAADPMSITAGGIVLSGSGGQTLPVDFVDFERPAHPEDQPEDPAGNENEGNPDNSSTDDANAPFGRLDPESLSPAMQALAELLGLFDGGETPRTSVAGSKGDAPAAGAAGSRSIAGGGAPGIAAARDKKPESGAGENAARGPWLAPQQPEGSMTRQDSRAAQGSGAGRSQQLARRSSGRAGVAPSGANAARLFSTNRKEPGTRGFPAKYQASSVASVPASGGIDSSGPQSDAAAAGAPKIDSAAQSGSGVSISRESRAGFVAGGLGVLLLLATAKATQCTFPLLAPAKVRGF